MPSKDPILVKDFEKESTSHTHVHESTLDFADNTSTHGKSNSRLLVFYIFLFESFIYFSRQFLECAFSMYVGEDTLKEFKYKAPLKPLSTSPINVQPQALWKQNK